MTDTPCTLIEAVRYFSDLDVCTDYLKSIRWPKGEPACPACESKRIGEIATRRMLRCKDCRKQFSVKVGTIFEDSPLGLDKWFVAVWSVANCKNGISSHELARALGVTQKTAWFMLHRIRKAMECESFDKFDGPAEADTAYVGGRAENMHKHKRAKRIKGRGPLNKVAVHGVLQRATDDKPSQISAAVIGSETSDRLITDVRRKVRYGAEVYTDQASAYGDLCLTHVHDAVDHSREYVRGAVHTNGVENFWSLLKRGLHGTYIAVAPFHLNRYVAEQAYRFNNRKVGDGVRFRDLVAQTIGKRLTYRKLCGIEDAGFMGLE